MSSRKDLYSFEKNKNLESFYQPGIFWEAALIKIENHFNQFGISKFRSDETNLSFFVPTYGCPGNGFDSETISRIYSSLENNLNCKQRRFLEIK